MRSTAIRICALLFAAPIAVSAGAQPKSASFAGKVFTDTTMKPLVGVEVLLPELSLSATTNDKGAFRIDQIPVGTHLVRARRIGYARFEANIEFKDGQVVERPIVLPRVTLIDSVRVVGEVNLPLSYLEHRAAGMGHFLARADLAKQENIRLPNILSQISGLGIVQGRANQGWILSKRYVASIKSIKQKENVPGTDLYVPDSFEKRAGVVAGCYARVYLDNLLINASTPAEPVDVSQYYAASLEAVEYYASAAQTPSRYSRLNSNCGVLVLHTRRSR